MLIELKIKNFCPETKPKTLKYVKFQLFRYITDEKRKIEELETISRGSLSKQEKNIYKERKKKNKRKLTPCPNHCSLRRPLWTTRVSLVAGRV